MFKYRHNKCVGRHSPVSHIRHLSTAKLSGNKKDVGAMYLSAPIPIFRLSHCPHLRISNVKPAHVERYIYTHYDLTLHTYTQVSPQNGLHLIIYIKEIRRRDIKSPTQTPLLHHRCKWIQICEI